MLSFEFGPQVVEASTHLSQKPDHAEGQLASHHLYDDEHSTEKNISLLYGILELLPIHLYPGFCSAPSREFPYRHISLIKTGKRTWASLVDEYSEDGDVVKGCVRSCLNLTRWQATLADETAAVRDAKFSGASRDKGCIAA